MNFLKVLLGASLALISTSTLAGESVVGKWSNPWNTQITVTPAERDTYIFKEYSPIGANNYSECETEVKATGDRFVAGEKTCYEFKFDDNNKAHRLDDSKHTEAGGKSYFYIKGNQLIEHFNDCTEDCDMEFDKDNEAEE